LRAGDVGGEGSNSPARLAPAMTDNLKKIEAPITVEQVFTVDGKRLTVLVVFPAAIAQEIGQENLLVAANRVVVNVESKSHRIEKVRR